MNETVLVADDQPDVRQAMKLLLRSEGYQVELAKDPDEVLAVMSQGGIDLLMLDLNYTRDTTSGREGLAVLQKLREKGEELPVVAMTAWGTVDVAMEAVRLGADDFLEKPWENLRLLSIIRTQLERSAAVRSEQRYQELARIRQDDKSGIEIIAEAESMQRVLAMAGQVAPAVASVLLTGENGTGKSMIAQQLHHWSDRADGPLVVLNMGSIPEQLFESEMFGHVKGAFTDAREARPGRFELADKGTLFLDEIGNLPAAQQAKLLRVLETGKFERVGASRTQEVDVRVVAATNANLLAMVEDGRFRRDLYFRLNTVEIRVPALRERKDDILLLARNFLARECARYKKTNLRLGPDACRTMLSYHWPGNVRELAHVMERAVLLCMGEEIKPQDLGLQVQAEQSTGLASQSAEASPHLEAPGDIIPLAQLEESMIKRALQRYEANVQLAADALGLSRSALYRRLEKYGIEL
ncbi:MAG: sigma-54 dependent transcriptional regulator [Xanthomonadales bacterium]|nr:sigma-54 dependent transcriptional regulator [Xanthomonadales bacterium]